MNVAEIAPFRVKKNAAPGNDFAPNENGTGQNRKSKPDMLRMWRHRMAMANIFSFAIRDNAAGEGDFDFRIGFKKSGDIFKRAGQVLFVAIQIREDVAGRAAVAAIDGVIHSTVLFDERLDAPVFWQPVQRAVVGAGILNDVFE